MPSAPFDVDSLDLSSYDSPGRGKGIFDAFKRHYLLRLLVRKGTATRYRNSILGWTWSYVKPAFQLVIFYFVMGLVLGMNRTVTNFAVYMFAGVVLLNLFTESFGNATRSILENGPLVQKIYLPRELFPLAATIVALIHFLPQVAILFAVCLLLGWTPSLLAVGAFLLAVAMVAAFSLGLGMLFGGINVRYRDAQNFVELITIFAVWSAPVLYQWQMVHAIKSMPGWLWSLYMCNPLTTSVMLFHTAFWAPTTSAPIELPAHFGIFLAASIAVTIVVLVLGQISFRHFEKTFAQDL
jgi:ABC-2 type transport system permease protein